MTNQQANDQVIEEYNIPENEPVSLAAIRVVSDLKDSDPLALSPLYDSIDPEMLDELCESLQDGTVKFVFADFHITVEEGDHLVLQPADCCDP